MTNSGAPSQTDDNGELELTTGRGDTSTVITVGTGNSVSGAFDRTVVSQERDWDTQGGSNGVDAVRAATLARTQALNSPSGHRPSR